MEQGNGIAAYDVPERIASYDRDMDVMHPNRHKMVQVALDLLPFECEREFLALDVGSGTGFFTQRLLEAFPNARVIAVDGARSMTETATERLGPRARSVDFRTGDFRDLDRILKPEERGLVAISAYALHHVDHDAKIAVIRRCLDFLEPGGWFFNADLIVAESERVEARIQELRVAGIVRRAGPDPRFNDPVRVRAFLDDLEATEGDQPLPLTEDLEILREAGLRHSGAFWSEYREAVTGGIKSSDQVCITRR